MATQESAQKSSIYIGNLSSEVTEADLAKLFEDCGKIVEVRMIKNREGASKGFAYVDFADGAAVQNAVAKKNGMNIKGQEIKVDVATSKRQVRSASEPNAPSATVYIGNLSYEAKEDDLKAAFKGCGIINNVRIIVDKRNDRPKGYAYIEFATVEEAKKALELRSEKILDRPISVDYAAPPGTRVVRSASGFRGGRGAPRGAFRGAPRGAFAPRGASRGGFRGGRGGFAPRGDRPEPVELAIPIDSKTVYVANLPYEVTPERIHQALSQCGQVLNIQMATVDGRPRGFAYVHFSQELEAQKAVGMNENISMEGRTLRIELARQQRERVPRAPITRPQAAPSNKIFVGNMPREMAAQAASAQLRSMFGGCGNITEIDTPAFPSGDFKGHALVTYANVADATKAVNTLTNLQMNGRELRVSFALSEEQRAAMPRREFRGRGGFRGRGRGMQQ